MDADYILNKIEIHSQLKHSEWCYSVLSGSENNFQQTFDKRHDKKKKAGGLETQHANDSGGPQNKVGNELVVQPDEKHALEKQVLQTQSTCRENK